jgi:NitT/TauT family transport system substrate-binding protein
LYTRSGFGKKDVGMTLASRAAFAWISATALLFAPETGCRKVSGASEGDADGHPLPSEQVRIGYSRLAISLPVFAAQELGLFQVNGVDVQLEQYDNGQLVGQAVLEGKIDIGGYLATAIGFNGVLRTGHRMYFVTAQLEDQQHRVSYLLRRKTPEGRQPEIRSVADLKGKRVGIFPTLAYKAILEALLRKSGVDPGSVTIQQTDAPLQPQLLASGGVDALFTIDPAGTAAISSGAGELVGAEVESPQLFGEPFIFASELISKEWADAHPDLARRVVKSLDEGAQYVNAHPKEAKAFLKKYLAPVYWPQINLYPDPLYLTSADAKDEFYARVASKYLEIGVIPKPIDLTGAVYHGDPVPVAN